MRVVIIFITAHFRFDIIFDIIFDIRLNSRFNPRYSLSFQNFLSAHYLKGLS